MKKIIILCLLAIYVSGVLPALGQKYLPAILPPSPNAASIGTYGNIPMNLSSGLPTVNLPLYSVSEGRINVPINLAYNYSGYRPSEEISTIGRGWSLQTGGIITRVVKGGIEDEWVSASGKETGGGYLVSGSKLAYAMNPATGVWNCNPDIDSKCIRAGGIGTQWDGEPDLFHFSFGNISGKFFFGSDGQIHIVSEQKLKIEYVTTSYFFNTYSRNRKNNNIIFCQITSEDGTIYKFGFPNESTRTAKNIEYTIASRGGYQDEIISSWCLYEIRNVYGDVVTFKYANDFLDPIKNISKQRQTLSGWESYVSGQGGSNFSESMRSDEQQPSTSFTYNFPGSRNTENAITEINGTNFKVKFNYIEKSEQIVIGWSPTTYKLLKGIDIYAQTSNPLIVKSFQLKHTEDNRRALLDSLKEVNNVGVLEKAHKFEYFGTIPSSINGFTRSIDFWNYYNAAPNTSFHPYNANRQPNLATTKIGALIKVTYPTGGSTTFDYELNEFSYVRDKLYSASDNTNLHKKTIGGLRVKSMTDNPVQGSVITRFYKYQDFSNANLSSGVVAEVMNSYAYKIALPIVCSNFAGSGTSTFESVISNIFSFGFVGNGSCPPNNIIYYSVFKSEPYNVMASVPVYYKNVIDSLTNNSKSYHTFTSHTDFSDFLGVSYGLGDNTVGSYSTKDFARSLPKNIRYYAGNKLVSEVITDYTIVDKHKAPVLYTEPVFTRSTTGETLFRVKGLNTYSGFLKKISERKIIYNQ